MNTTDAVNWFEIGSDRPGEAARFYGELFGWTFADQRWPGWSYQVTEGGTDPGIGGAIAGTDGGPGYAIFYVQVADVVDTCRRAEAAGGRVLLPLATTPSGLTFAHLADLAGNRLGVFTPRPS